jgi:hypothetical protein
MNVLLSLPDEVVIPILGEWLCVKNVRSLDTAMCQRHPREDFLTVLSKSVMSNDELRTAFLRDKTLEWVVQKKLRYADISIFWKKLDSRIEVISAILANQGLALRSLRYYGNRNMDSNCPHLYTVLSHCTNLESLFVERVLFESDNEALSRFSQANSTLKRLHLLECGGINTTNCAALCAHLSHLEGIDLRLSDVDDACIPVIMERCPKLWSLELFGCSGITDTGALAIAQHGAKLVHISISDTRATEVGAAAVAASSPNLKDINLERVQFRSPSLAASIARSCPLLENLSFVGCGAITGRAGCILPPKLSLCVSRNKWAYLCCSHFFESTSWVTTPFSPCAFGIVCFT